MIIGALFQTVAALPTKNIVQNILSTKKFPVKFPFSANVSSKVFMGNQSIKDSGTIFTQPPDCMTATMFRANTLQSSCGDTTWIRAGNGTISRSIGASEDIASGLPGITSPQIPSTQKLDTNAMMISFSDLANCVRVVLVDEEGTLSIDIDTLKKVVMKSTATRKGAPSFQTGFAYELFESVWVIKEIRSSLPGGFFVITYTDYKKEKKRARKSFRLL